MTPAWEAMLVALVGVPLMMCAACGTSHQRWPVTPVAVTAAGVVIGLCAASDVALVWPVLAYGVPAAIVDTQERRLPDVLTAGLALTTAITIAVVVPTHLADAALAAAATAAVAFTTKILTPDTIGWGDVKLLPSLAAALAALGPGALYRGVLFWVGLLGLTVGLWWAGHGGRAEPVPFGPALVAGTLGALLVA